MSGGQRMEGRRWPTAQQLVIVSGEPELVAQWFDAVREHHEAARDLIDLFDDERMERHAETLISHQFTEAIDRMRHTLWAVRQWDVDA